MTHVAISILLVSEPGRHAALEAAFGRTRWQLRQVKSAAAAFAALRGEEVHVVLCDRELPDGTWVDVLEAAGRCTPAVPVIVLTDEASQRVWTEVLRLGGFDVLAMPCLLEELYTAVPTAWQRYARGVPAESRAATVSA